MIHERLFFDWIPIKHRGLGACSWSQEVENVDGLRACAYATTTPQDLEKLVS